MHLRVGSDDFRLYYVSADDDLMNAEEIPIEMSAASYADYKRVQAEHESWQKWLHQLWQRQQQRMNG